MNTNCILSIILDPEEPSVCWSGSGFHGQLFQDRQTVSGGFCMLLALANFLQGASCVERREQVCFALPGLSGKVL